MILFLEVTKLCSFFLILAKKKKRVLYVKQPKGNKKKEDKNVTRQTFLIFSYKLEFLYINKQICAHFLVPPISIFGLMIAIISGNRLFFNPLFLFIYTSKRGG